MFTHRMNKEILKGQHLYADYSPMTENVNVSWKGYFGLVTLYCFYICLLYIESVALESEISGKDRWSFHSQNAWTKLHFSKEILLCQSQKIFVIFSQRPTMYISTTVIAKMCLREARCQCVIQKLSFFKLNVQRHS